MKSILNLVKRYLKIIVLIIYFYSFCFYLNKFLIGERSNLIRVIIMSILFLFIVSKLESIFKF